MARARHRLAGRLWRWSHPGRGFRAVRRELRTEKRRRVTAGLGRLSDRHVPVVAVRCVAGGDDAAEFADGTRLVVEVRDGEIAWQRLVAQRPLGGTYIGRVEPLFGNCWFRLHFYVLGAERLRHRGPSRQPNA